MLDPLVQQTLADAVAFFEGRGVPFALIGGLAVSFRGQPRATADVDVVLDADVETALRIAAELLESPFEPLFPGVEEVVERSFILPLRHRTTRLKVDASLGLSGFEQAAIARAEYLDLPGLRAPVVTAEDLLLMKILAGRPQDEQDASGLVAVRRSDFDWEYCRRVAIQLGSEIGQDLVSRVDCLRRGSD